MPIECKYTFVVEPYGYEVDVIATSQKEAYSRAFLILPQAHQDSCQILDCVDIQEI